MGIPLPPMDLYFIVVDTLANRYGWSWTEISQNMYWEEVYDLYEFASNLDVLEKNEQMKFQFMLHAGSKEAVNKWRDTSIPFPDREWIPPTRKRKKQEDISPSFSRRKNTAKMTPAQRERRDLVKKRVLESRQKAAREQREYYYGN